MIKIVQPTYYSFFDFVSDFGGFGSAVFAIGDTIFRVLSRYSFMKTLLSMLFLVRVMDPLKPMDTFKDQFCSGSDKTRKN